MGLNEMGFKEHLWEHVHKWHHWMFLIFCTLAMCCAINCVVLCGVTVIFGPGLGLRGGVGQDAVKAVDGMREERMTSFRLLICAVLCLLIALVPVVWMRTSTITGSVIITVQGGGIALMAFLVYATPKKFKGEVRRAP